MDLPLGIEDAVVAAATFIRAAATIFSPTVAYTGMNTGNLLGELILWHIEYSDCKVIILLRICNAVKVSPNFNILYCVLELNVLDPPE